MCKTKLTIFNRVQITRTRTKYSDHVGQVYQVRVEAPRGRQDAGRLADHTPSLLLRGLGLILFGYGGSWSACRAKTSTSQRPQKLLPSCICNKFKLDLQSAESSPYLTYSRLCAHDAILIPYKVCSRTQFPVPKVHRRQTCSMQLFCICYYDIHCTHFKLVCKWSNCTQCFLITTGMNGLSSQLMRWKSMLVQYTCTVSMSKR